MGVDLGCPQVYESAWNTHTEKPIRLDRSDAPRPMRTYKKHNTNNEFVQLGCLQVYENQISRTRAGDPQKGSWPPQAPRTRA